VTIARRCASVMFHVKRTGVSVGSLSRKLSHMCRNDVDKSVDIAVDNDGDKSSVEASLTPLKFQVPGLLKSNIERRGLAPYLSLAAVPCCRRCILAKAQKGAHMH